MDKGGNVFKYLFIVFLIALASITLYVLSKNDTVEEALEDLDQTSTASNIQKDLRFAIAEFDTINPIISNNRNVHELSKIIFEPLVTLSPSYEVVYDLATGVTKEVSEERGIVYTVSLRKDVNWSNGTPFTSEDVKYTIDQIKSGEFRSIYQENLKSVISLNLVDEHTIEIFLSENDPFFEYKLTFPIMSSAYYGESGFTDEEKNLAPVSTGKFKINELVNNQIKLTYNDYYYDKTKEPMVEEVIITKYGTMGEVYNAFKSGDIDFLNIKVNNAEDYIGTIGYSRIEYKSRNFDYMAINTQNELLSSTNVRKAISYLIDKNNMISVLGAGYIVSNFPLDYGSWLYTRDLNVETNLDYASQLLHEDGWELKNNVWQKKEGYRTHRLEFTILVNNNDELRVRAAENIAEQCTNFGIKVNVQSVNADYYNNLLNQRRYDLAIVGIQSGFTPDLRTFFGDNNLAGFENEEAKNIVNNASDTTDKKELAESYNRLFDIYLEEVPYIGLYRETDLIVSTQSLVGTIMPNSYDLYQNIELWYRQ